VNDGPLVAQVRAILGEERLVLLAQELGGTRVYLPTIARLRDDHDIVQAVGRAAAEALSRALAPAWLTVPLARRERARYWRGKGLSEERTARKLGMTRSGLQKLLAREEGTDEAGGLPNRRRRSTHPDQLSFETLLKRP
jgi:DNA-binding CsgD family transcriptional regulator